MEKLTQAYFHKLGNDYYETAHHFGTVTSLIHVCKQLLERIEKLEGTKPVENEFSNDYARGFLHGLEMAAREAVSWGDECAGGSGREKIKVGPSAGQLYGQAYYNLADKIRRVRPEKGQ